MERMSEHIKALTAKLKKSAAPVDSTSTPLSKTAGALRGPTPSMKMVYGNPAARNKYLMSAEAELKAQSRKAQQKK